MINLLNGMKTLLTLSIWMVVFAGFASAQVGNLALRELPIEGRKVKGLATDEDGYLVLAYSERRAQGESPYGNMYSASLMRLDRELNTVWDLTFPETIMPEIKSVATTGEYCYMGGNRFNRETKKSRGLLIKLDGDGKVLDTKEYAVEGYNSTEISGIRVLPDDELLLCMDVYHAYGSAGLPCIARVDRNGRILWRRVLETTAAYAATAHTLLLQDGGLLVACMVMPTREDLREGKRVYSLAHLNFNTGQLQWTRRIPEIQGLQQVFQEPDGSLTAFCSHDGEVKRAGGIIRLQTDGTQPQVLYRAAEGEGLVEHIAVVDSDPRGVYTGVGYLDRNCYRFMKLRSNGEVLWQHSVKQPMLVGSEIRPSGGMLMAFQHRLVLAE